MIGLNGKLTSTDIARLKELTKIRFIDPNAYKCSWAVVAYEQRMLSDEEIYNECRQEYAVPILEIPQLKYVTEEVIRFFEGHNCVPYALDNTSSVIHVMVLPENANKYVPNFNYLKTVKHIVPIYYFVSNYTKLYGEPEFLGALAPKDIWEFIVAEAVNLGASDITLSVDKHNPKVYYDVRKKKVYSRRTLTKAYLNSIISFIADKSKATSTRENNAPRYMSMDLDAHHRGRIVINSNYYGKMVSIRVLSNDSFDTSLEDLNLKDNVVEFIREHFIKLEPGLHLMIGPTSGGKNTTIISSFRELLMGDKYKCVSIEKPVEMLLEGLEQINVETEEDYRLNIESLLRQNPDIIYLSEMTDSTALSIMEVANTSKPVFTTVHASSIADVITRITDLTGLNADRVIMSMQSCIYQTLVRDEKKDKIFPHNTVLYFSDELKKKLFGKSQAEIYLILKEEEKKIC